MSLECICLHRKFVGHHFTDGCDCPLSNWLLLSLVLGPRGSLSRWYTPRGLIVCLVCSMLSPKRTLMRSQSHVLGKTSHLEGMMRDLSIRVRQNEVKSDLSIPDTQTPDPPVEPMGVLQRVYQNQGPMAQRRLFYHHHPFQPNHSHCPADETKVFSCRSKVLVPVSSQRVIAPTITYAWSAGAADMSRGTQTVKKARARVAKEMREHKDLHPQYVRDFLWEEDRRLSFITSADLSCNTSFALPLPSAPPCSSFCPEFLHTVDNDSNLFKIVTPVNVDCLEYLLADHPN